MLTTENDPNPTLTHLTLLAGVRYLIHPFTIRLQRALLFMQ
nr:MAG TPA: hypothetical protein [Caudoviricetes sp.]